MGLSHRPVARAIGLLLLLSSTACTRARGPDLVFWAMGSEGDAVQGLLGEFRRRHPRLEVRIQQVPWSAAHEKLLTAFVGGALPDVFQLGTTWVAEFAALGALQPLDAWLQPEGPLPPEDFFPGILEASRIGGSLHAVPWYVDTRLLFYRTDLLGRSGRADPPRTWAAWSEAMARIRAEAGPGRHAILAPLRDWQLPVILALERGATLLRDGDCYGNFRSAEFRAAFDFYLDLFRRDLAPAAGDALASNLYRDFADGAFCFYVTGPWNLGEFARRLPAALQDQWSTAPMPAFDGRGPGVSLAGGAGLAVSRDSPRKDAARALIEFLSSPAQQVEFYRRTGDLPARRSAWQDAALRGDPRALAFLAQLEAVEPTPRIPEWERIAAKIAHYAERAVRGGMSAESALAALDEEVDRILEKRRFLLGRAQPAREHSG